MPSSNGEQFDRVERLEAYLRTIAGILDRYVDSAEKGRGTLADVQTQATALRLVADNLEDYLDPGADSDMEILPDDGPL
jgi:hypothetical protein